MQRTFLLMTVFMASIANGVYVPTVMNQQWVNPGTYGRDPTPTGGKECLSALDCNRGKGMCDKMLGYNNSLMCICTNEYSAPDCFLEPH